MNGQLLPVRRDRPVPELRRPPLFGPATAGAGQDCDLSQLRACLHGRGGRRRRPQIGRGEETQRSPRRAERLSGQQRPKQREDAMAKGQMRSNKEKKKPKQDKNKKKGGATPSPFAPMQ